MHNYLLTDGQHNLLKSYTGSVVIAAAGLVDHTFLVQGYKL